jgi:hypothetical protein
MSAANESVEDRVARGHQQGFTTEEEADTLPPRA